MVDTQEPCTETVPLLQLQHDKTPPVDQVQHSATVDIYSATPISLPSPLNDCCATPPSSSSPSPQPLTTTSHAFGYTLMAASSLCHALMTFLVHIAEINYSFPSASAVVIRACTSLTLSTIYLLCDSDARSSFVTLTPRTASLLALRGFFGGLSALLSFAALARLPVGTAITLFYASPALTAIASSFILHDHPLTLPLLLTILVNFLGVALVSSGGTSILTTGIGHVDGVLCALGMACCSTAVFISQRAMGLRVHFVLGVFAYGLGCAMLAGMCAKWDDVLEVVYNHKGALFALGSGLAGFGSQCFLNRGLQHAPAGPAIVVRSMNVPGTFVLGLVFLGEKVTLAAVGGVALVLGSVVMIGLQKIGRAGRAG